MSRGCYGQLEGCFTSCLTLVALLAVLGLTMCFCGCCFGGGPSPSAATGQHG